MVKIDGEWVEEIEEDFDNMTDEEFVKWLGLDPKSWELVGGFETLEEAKVFMKKKVRSKGG